ncbi:MAG: class I SAM-dependent methyltransferase [Reyranellaceae bacterium]
MTPSPSPPAPPSPWLARWIGLLPPEGTALDVACGSGRHLRLLRDRGHRATGIDRDVSGLAALDGVEIVEADLETGPWPLPGRRFAAVLVSNYLHRPLFPDLRAALEPGGLLVYETFAAGNEKYGRPSNPDFLLRAGELLDMARGALRVLAWEAVETTVPRRAVVQRLAALKPKD